jgi:hypothetical protein
VRFLIKPISKVSNGREAGGKLSMDGWPQQKKSGKG